MRENKLFDLINLHAGEEQRHKVLENVKVNLVFRGANLWILACAIVICSVGLNINSTAVVIGAMLISPIMGPIVGAGFALAIYDFELLKRSFKNLFISTFVGLVVAFVYFFVTPFKDTQSEILARTSPTIYDVIIAFFGGIVGVIAITRVEKGNPIPGVAIATALMPPLCTAGFGLATGNFNYFFGAFYLYTINCFFICIATFFIIKFLRYAPVKIVDPEFERRIRFGITVLILLMIVPSFYLAYNLIQEKEFSQKVERFINTEFVNQGYTIIYKNTRYHSNPKRIELAFLTKKFDDQELEQLNDRMPIYDLENTLLDIRQDATSLKDEILSEIGQREQVLTEKDILIRNLQQELQQYTVDERKTIDQIRILFPQLQNVSIGKHQINAHTDSARFLTVVLYTANRNATIEREKLETWLQSQLETQDILLIRQ
ncbi:MAG: DUF389 domain-containing protein [Weeksellaceae bacterium]|nr:DUF389 domain-containing protein [Weeksellaceae bacterium]